MATLIITEKKKAAEAISNALGKTIKTKISKRLEIYFISSKNLYVIPLRGHLLEYRNTDIYKSWANPPPREIITNEKAIKKFQIRGLAPYIKAVKDYAKKCDHVIISTDADIEGCNIGLFDALPFVKQANPNIKVSQLWLSSLQKSEINNKFNNLVTPRYSWGESGEARAIIDAFIGFSATREITNTLRPLLNKFRVRFTSIGRVQTSLLYLIYLREKEILDFVPEPYFLIDADLIHSKGVLKAHHHQNPFSKNQETKAKQIYEKIRDEKIGHIVDNSKKVIKRSPPSPLNTSKALVLLTKNLRISANRAMQTMNALYLNQIISYPRTDSDVYKLNFNHKEIIQKFTNHSKYKNYSSNLLKQNRIIPTKGNKDMGDHPPITPLESLNINSSRFENELQKKVYDLLVRHYLALFGEDALESKQFLKILIKDEQFNAQIVSLIFPGFLEIAPFLKPRYDTEIQIVGDKIPVKGIIFSKKETKPPPRYTDTSLLKLMEKNHLGTKSTRPVIIKLLQTRKLTVRIKNHYKITDLGIFIIENLIKIWLPFLKPEFTKKVEIKLEEIKTKTRRMKDVINEIRNEFLQLFDKFLINKHKLVSEINNYKIEYSIPLTTSNCPFCNLNEMKFINAKTKRFLVCSDDKCKRYLSLPRNGKLELLDSTCSICNFNIFRVTLKKNNKPYNYYLCPECWNEGLNDKSGKGFCSNCEEFKIF
ncbi:MAG: DNA topoisomerase, partial [Candidatus Thorarchaeota archaeon]